MTSTNVPTADLRSGLVIYARAGHYEVEYDSQRVHCTARGRLKKEKLATDLIVAGDRVRWRPVGHGRGVIEEVLPRESRLSRPRPGSPGAEDLILANPDQVVIILAARHPEPNLRLLDRFLVASEASELPAIVCANKVDLLDEDEDPRDVFGLYEEIGYPVIYTSALTGQGIDALRARLHDKLTVFAGPSGVGKTSLLNAIQPELGLATRRVSRATGKGRHATVTARLFPLEQGGYVGDTPGLREMGLWEIEPEELDWFFPEMRPFLGKCRFSSCTHTHEPECAVIAAVEAGTIDEERYESYCRMRGE